MQCDAKANSFKAWCIKNNKETLLNEWNLEMNSSLSPNTIAARSHKKIWWTCLVGHTWQTSLSNRTNINKGTGCPYCSNKKVLPGYNDLLTLIPSLATEWDYEKNTNLTPRDVTKNCTKKVWWICSNKHNWQATILSRTQGNDCPYCSNQQVLYGYNDLLTTYPDIAKEWSSQKNDGLNPKDLVYGSTKKVWWTCTRCNYEWQTAVRKRTLKGTGCPKCASVNSGEKRIQNKINKCGSFQEWCIKNNYIDLLNEWNTDKNADLSPDQITVKSGKNIWWKCNHCKFEWETRLYNRTKPNPTGCPVCANLYVFQGVNDLMTLKPNIGIDWNYSKNTDTNPCKVSINSKQRVWWKCKDCNFEWQATINTRCKGQRCPNCLREERRSQIKPRIKKEVKSLYEEFPELAKEWNYERNGNLTPETISSHYSKRVWWKCAKQHEWITTIESRAIRHTNCPRCSRYGTSLPEYVVFYYVSSVFNNTEHRSKPFGFELDVYIPEYKIGIEYDGSLWHSGKNAEDKDTRKDEACYKNGIYLIRIKESNNNKVEDNTIYYNWDSDYSEIDFPVRLLLALIFSYINKTYNIDINWLRDRDSIEALYREEINYPKNSVAIVNPNLAMEWNYDKNGSLTPEQFSVGSNRNVWWMCSKGHEWQASISSRAKGVGCPACVNLKVEVGINDLASQRPDLLDEWHYDKNEMLTPSDVVYGSPKKVWWICSKCNCEWQTEIRKRAVDNTGCPYCAGRKIKIGVNDLTTTNKELVSEWHYIKNGSLKPTMVTRGSSKQVWWQCSTCNHNWKTSVSNRARLNSGCPKCKNTISKKIMNIDTGLVFNSIAEAEKYYSISHGRISMCCKGTRKTAGGYHWKYWNKKGL